MRWLKRDTWKISIGFAGLLLLLVLLVWVPVSAASAYERASRLATSGTGMVQATPTVDPTIMAAIAKEQLRKLERDNDRSFQAWFWTSGATFLSTLVLVSGALLGFWQWRVNRNDTQKKESKDQRTAQDNELKDRQAERERRAEERFQKVVEGLGGDKSEARAGAAIMLRTFLQPDYKQFYRQSFDLAVAHLRLRHDNSNIPAPLDLNAPTPPEPSESVSLDPLSQALITVFKEAFPLAMALMNQEKSQSDRQSLDASRIRLDNAYLVGSDLKDIWMREAFLIKADLRRANLSGARLTKVCFGRANLREANLYKAFLYKADFRGAYLRGANLGEAYLREADFRGAHLRGVDFDEADLREANFDGAHLRGVDLRTVIGLTKEQLEACKAKGAIIDEASMTSLSTSSQSNDVQTPSGLTAQESTSTPDAGGTSKPATES